MSPRIAPRLKASWNCRSCRSRRNCIIGGGRAVAAGVAEAGLAAISDQHRDLAGSERFRWDNPSCVG